MSFVLAGLIWLAACAGSTDATAQGLIREVRGGVLAHDVPDLWSGFRTERDSVAINLEAVLAAELPLFGGVLVPAFGGTIATEGGTSNAYFDLRWEYEFGSGWFMGAGIGAAVHDGELRVSSIGQTDKALGSRVLFHIPAEIGYRFDRHNSLSVYFEHLSNANTSDVNEGLDRLGVRYGYRF